jgi:hypothetical protein
MKFFFVPFLLFMTLHIFGQETFIAKSGFVAFEASVPTFEEIKAENNKVTAIFKTDTGDIAVLALVQGFRFPIALMEEHFNENYAESERYPKTMFLGKIIEFSKEKIKSRETVAISLAGSFTFHGITKQIQVPATICFKDAHYLLSAKFSLAAADYNIKIPKIVRNKIADDISVLLLFKLFKK